MSADNVIDPVFGLRHRFWRSTRDGGAEVQHVETIVVPGGGVTPHLHPAMQESLQCPRRPLPVPRRP